MKGRYAGVQMRARTALLPGAARLARLPAEPSAEAKRRMILVKWFLEHERRLRLTARHFGRSTDTVRRWVDGYEQRAQAASKLAAGDLEMCASLRRRLTFSNGSFSSVRRTQVVAVRSCTGSSWLKASASHPRASIAPLHASRPAAYFANRSCSGSPLSHTSSGSGGRPAYL